MSCRCQAATLRAYSELIRAGVREDRAYDASVCVFRHYHPEHDRAKAYQITADWLDNLRVDHDGEIETVAASKLI